MLNILVILVGSNVSINLILVFNIQSTFLIEVIYVRTYVNRLYIIGSNCTYVNMWWDEFFLQSHESTPKYLYCTYVRMKVYRKGWFWWLFEKEDPNLTLFSFENHNCFGTQNTLSSIVLYCNASLLNNDNSIIIHFFKKSFMIVW